VIELSKNLQPIYGYELSLGNEEVAKEELVWDSCPLAIHFLYPMHFAEIERDLGIPPTVVWWEVRDTHYMLESGYKCLETQHMISGPIEGKYPIEDYDQINLSLPIARIVRLLSSKKELEAEETGDEQPMLFSDEVYQVLKDEGIHGELSRMVEKMKETGRKRGWKVEELPDGRLAVDVASVPDKVDYYAFYPLRK